MDACVFVGRLVEVALLREFAEGAAGFLLVALALPLVRLLHEEIGLGEIVTMALPLLGRVVVETVIDDERITDKIEVALVSTQGERLRQDHFPGDVL